MARPRKTQAERREEAERRLTEAAVVLVSEQGYDGFTLSEIGVEAGYSAGLPAHYFGRKETIMAAAAAEIVGAFEESKKRLSPDVRGLGRVLETIEVYIEGVFNDPVRMKALHVILGAAITRPKLKSTVRSLNEEGRRFIRDEIEFGKQIGNIRQDANSDIEALAITAFLRGVIPSYLMDETIDVRGAGKEFSRWVEASLSPPK